MLGTRRYRVEDGHLILNYVKDQVTIFKTITGFTEIDNIDTYYLGEYVRNNVIYKMDMVLGLVGSLMNECTVSKYRDAIYGVISGRLHSDVNYLSDIIMELYDIDRMFKINIMELVDIGMTVTEMPLMDLLVARVLEQLSEYRTQLLSKTPVNKIIVEANGYLYISAPDELGVYELIISHGGAKLSNAKNW